MFALIFKIKNDEMVLHGDNVQPPLRACVRQANRWLDNGHCLETLDLVIEGQTGQSRPLIARLQSFLERIRLGQEAVLLLTPDSRSEPYQSRLYGGDFTWIAGSIQLKGIGLRLELERDDYWELPLRAIPLHNRYGSEVVEGLRVDNRMDSGGENQLFWPAEAISGDMPTPLQIRLINDRQPGQVLDDLYLGSSRVCSQDLPLLEGEAAASPESFSVVMDSSCNGGAYGRVQWSGSQELEILSWLIPGTQLIQFAGSALRPLLRFVDGQSFPQDTWLRWAVLQGGTVYQSAACALQPDAALQILPDLRLPTLPYGYETPADVQVRLYARSRENNPVIALDAVFLLGLDGWQHLEPLEDGQFVYGTAMLADSSLDYPLLVNLNNQASQRAYRFNGFGLWSTPMEDQAVQLLAVHNGQMPLAAQLGVQISYRPRVRVLL